MNSLPDTTSVIKTAYATSNTNTTTLTLNAIADERHVIDWVIFSVDAKEGSKNHFTIRDSTTNTTILRTTAPSGRPNELTFGGGLPFEINRSVVLQLVSSDTPTTNNNITVGYR